jgi:hypothetical protein
MTEYQASNIAVEDTENSTLIIHGLLTTLQESLIKKWQQ